MKYEKALLFRDIYNAVAGSLSLCAEPKKYIKCPVIYILLSITYSAASNDNKGRNSDSSEL